MRGLIYGLWVVAIAAFALLMAGAVRAGSDYVPLSDLVIYYQPQLPAYTPDRSDLNASETGQAFDIDCKINASGHLTDCQAEDDDDMDPGFVHAALRSMNDWVVGDQTRDGQPDVGMRVRVEVRFQLRS